MPTYEKEHIARYLQNELSDEERSAFETSMQTDTALAEEVALYREALTHLQQRLSKDPTAEALRNNLQSLNKEYFRKEEAKVVSFVKYLPRIVAVAAVLVIGIMVWQLRDSYLNKYGDITMVATAERGNGSDTLLQQATVFFNNKEFDKALPLLDKAVLADSADQLALFYRGIALLHTQSVDAARKDLEKIYNGESLMRYEAAFYLAISYAEEKNKETAIAWLKKIPAGTPVSEKAQALLKKLD
ncbi:MAG: tetratricopeptide repeat protein [Chitinophagaceae bacterium]